jgi:hypothetical protein
VFGSPRRLNLQLQRKATTPVRETLDVWPRLPIVIFDLSESTLITDGDNIIAALERHDRVCHIVLRELTSFVLEQLSTVMQEPFPALMRVFLHASDDSDPLLPVLPDTFLGGSARLRSLELLGIPFPALPKLLLSSHDLDNVILNRIPHTGYFSPEAMAVGLSAMATLRFLRIDFKSPASCPDRRHRRPPPSTRVVLPALNHLYFRGVSEYFEDLMARIDTPVIRTVKTEFFNQLIFDIPQYFQFVGRTEVLMSFKQAELFFVPHAAIITLRRFKQSKGRKPLGQRDLSIYVSCRGPDWQISSFAQICSQFSLFLSNVERLDIEGRGEFPSNWEDDSDMDHTQWLELVRPFTAVQSLHINHGLGANIAPALQELTGDRVMEVLPALRSLSFSRDVGENVRSSIRKAYEPFITARQLINCPVTVH